MLTQRRGAATLGRDRVYVAGDASRDVQLVVMAAAEGVKAAFLINPDLITTDGLA